MGRLGAQLMQFAASLVLARLLSPTEFGLFADVLVFTQFSQLLFELGMGAALVQLPEVDDQDLSTVFWLNAAGGLVFAGLMVAAGPLIAAFFHEPQLRVLAPLTALTYTLNIGVCHLALLQRALRFRAIAGAELVAAFVGFVVTVVLALSGVGVTALAIGLVVQNAGVSLVVWCLVPWRPGRVVARASVVRVWRFCAGMLGTNVVNYWGRNADNLLIGRFLGAAPLGLYNRAFNLMSLPVQQVSLVVGRVMLPVLAGMQDDRARSARVYRRTLRAVNVATVPVLVGLAAVSPALVPLLWGERWAPMVPLLAVVCLAGVPQCQTLSVGWVFQAQGRTGTMFKMGSLSAGLGVLAMLPALHWGAIGVAWAVFARGWLFTMPAFFVACRLLDLSGWRVLADNVMTLALSGAMGVLVWLLPVLGHLSRTAPTTLLLQVAVGVAAYAVGCWCLQRALVEDARAMLGRHGAEVLAPAPGAEVPGSSGPHPLGPG